MKTRQTILAEIIKETKQKIPEISNYRVGGVFRTFVEVVASFLEKVYIELDNILSNRFITTSTGEFLDLKAKELGLIRYQASKTTGEIVFSRADDKNAVTVRKGVIVSSRPNYQGDVFRYKVLNDATINLGEKSVSVLVEAEEAGERYNLVDGLIREFVTNISGVDSINNHKDWIVKAGKDIESDEMLRSRCLAMWTGINGANKDAYISWVKQIPEVQEVRVIPTVKGPGTVAVVITVTNNQSPNEELLAKVRNVIEDKKPIGVEVSVMFPAEVYIDVDLIVNIHQSEELSTNTVRDVVLMYFSQMHTGQDFEPSSLNGFLFARLPFVKSVNVSAGRKNITDLQIAVVGQLNINVKKDEYR